MILQFISHWVSWSFELAGWAVASQTQATQSTQARFFVGTNLCFELDALAQQLKWNMEPRAPVRKSTLLKNDELEFFSKIFFSV